MLITCPPTLKVGGRTDRVASRDASGVGIAPCRARRAAEYAGLTWKLPVADPVSLPSCPPVSFSSTPWLPFPKSAALNSIVRVCLGNMPPRDLVSISLPSTSTVRLRLDSGTEYGLTTENDMGVIGGCPGIVPDIGVAPPPSDMVFSSGRPGGIELVSLTLDMTPGRIFSVLDMPPPEGEEPDDPDEPPAAETVSGGRSVCPSRAS